MKLSSLLEPGKQQKCSCGCTENIYFVISTDILKSFVLGQTAVRKE